MTPPTTASPSANLIADRAPPALIPRGSALARRLL